MFSRSALESVKKGIRFWGRIKSAADDKIKFTSWSSCLHKLDMSQMDLEQTGQAYLQTRQATEKYADCKTRLLGPKEDAN